VKRTRETVTLETKVLVIRKMEAAEAHANVCSSFGFAWATVSIIMASAEKIKYRIFRSIARTLSFQKRSEIVKNEHARYTLERFPTDNACIIFTKKGIGKYSIVY
jgi:hypothetical protein